MAADARQAGEIWQAIEREIYFARGAAVFVAANVFQEIRREIARVHHFQKGEIWIYARGNHRSANFFAAIQDYAFGPPILDQNFRDDSFGANFYAGFARRVGDGIGDCAGAAAAKAPGAEGPVDFAHVMMEQDVGGARRAYAQESADNSRRRHGGF